MSFLFPRVDTSLLGIKFTGALIPVTSQRKIYRGRQFYDGPKRRVRHATVIFFFSYFYRNSIIRPVCVYPNLVRHYWSTVRLLRSYVSADSTNWSQLLPLIIEITGTTAKSVAYSTILKFPKRNGIPGIIPGILTRNVHYKFPGLCLVAPSLSPPHFCLKYGRVREHSLIYS